MIHDVAIIGAGPCGLAVAARLREPSPSALFTEEEHSRFWRRRHGERKTVERETKKTRSPSSQVNDPAFPQASSPQRPSMVVFDAHSNGWMTSWRLKFHTLQIAHLRSPLFFHPDPQDRDGLLAYAHFNSRQNELLEIPNVVGQEISKHSKRKKRKSSDVNQTTARHLYLDNRDKNDYFTPSSSLFDDYCDQIIARYNLHRIVQQAKIESIEYGFSDVPTESSKIFTLTTTSGDTHLARTVVLATGPSSNPCIPECCKVLSPPSASGSACHIFDPKVKSTCFPTHLQNKVEFRQHSTVAVIGGGLTSAQVCHLLLETGVTKVHLVLRGKLKVKHFDVDLPWVSKLRNREMSVFWSADSDEERFALLKEARGGGSITPAYKKVLQSWQAKGRLEIWCDSEISSEESTWNETTLSWEIELRRTITTTTSNEVVQSIRLKAVDHLIFATSVVPDITKIGFLKSLRQQYPIESIKGLPILSEDLMWNDEVPLFVTGALAGLRLGPGAGNLAGARLGAERIAWGLEKGLKDETTAKGRIVRDSTRDGRKSPSTLSSISSEGDSGYASEEEALDKSSSGYNDFINGFRNQFDILTLE